MTIDLYATSVEGAKEHIRLHNPSALIVEKPAREGVVPILDVLIPYEPKPIALRYFVHVGELPPHIESLLSVMRAAGGIV